MFPVRFDVLSGQLQRISLFVWSKIDSPVSQKPCEVTLVRWPRAPWSVEMLLVCCHLQTLVLLWVLKPNCNDFLCTGHVLFYSQHLFYWNIFFLCRLITKTLVVLVLHIYIHIYIICNRFTVALNQEALEARIEVSWHSGLKVWWWSFLAIVASNRSREAKVILGSFATRIFSSLQRLQCFCVFFCIWRETSLYTQIFRPHLIPSFALTAGQIYHVGPSSPEAEVHPVTVSVALCKRD